MMTPATAPLALPMANPAKAKGTAWESAVVTYLKSEGLIDARRNAQYGAADIGDIGGVPRFAIECKAQRTTSLSDWVRQAKVEAGNAGADFGVVVAKKVGGRVGDAYVVTDLATFTELAKALTGVDQESALRDLWADSPVHESAALTVVVDDLPALVRQGIRGGP